MVGKFQNRGPSQGATQQHAKEVAARRLAGSRMMVGMMVMSVIGVLLHTSMSFQAKQIIDNTGNIMKISGTSLIFVKRFHQDDEVGTVALCWRSLAKHLRRVPRLASHHL